MRGVPGAESVARNVATREATPRLLATKGLTPMLPLPLGVYKSLTTTHPPYRGKHNATNQRVIKSFERCQTGGNNSGNTFSALMFSITYGKALASRGRERPVCAAKRSLSPSSPPTWPAFRSPSVRPPPVRSPASACRFRGAPGPGSPVATGFRSWPTKLYARGAVSRCRQSSGGRRKRRSKIECFLTGEETRGRRGR